MLCLYDDFLFLESKVVLLNFYLMMNFLGLNLILIRK